MSWETLHLRRFGQTGRAFLKLAQPPYRSYARRNVEWFIQKMAKQEFLHAIVFNPPLEIVIQSLSFVIAITMLVYGVLRLRRFLFISSFLVLFLACFIALMRDGSSGAISFSGVWLYIYGFACFILSRMVKPSTFVSRVGLVNLGMLFLILGFMSMMII